MTDQAANSEHSVAKFRYFIELAYDGTNYCGWQRQLNVPTVQAVIEDALSAIYHTKIILLGCGRTDSGVHASQYFAHINVPEKKDYLLKALRGSIPKDIVIKRIFEVDSDSHARFDATERSYVYKLHRTLNPFDRYYSLYHPLKNLNRKAIEQACELFTMHTNYLQFCKQNPDIKEHTSEVRKAEWIELNDGNNVEFHVSANRFLHHQIRRMTGCLIDVGTGKYDISHVELALTQNNALPYVTKLGPQGLYLSSVKYPFIPS